MPPGGGINFFLDLISGSNGANVFNKETNEYKYTGNENSIRPFWNSIDHNIEATYCESYNFKNPVTVDMLGPNISAANRFINIDPTLETIDINGHNPPMLLAAMFNLSINEQLAVIPSESTDFFIKFLSFIKKFRAIKVWDNDKHLLIYLLELYGRAVLESENGRNLLMPVGPVNNKFLDLSQQYKDTINVGSVFSFQCLFYSLEKGVPLTDNIVTEFINKHVRENILGQFSYRTQFRYKCIVETTKMANKGAIVDYEDFYFKRNMPDLKMLETVNTDRIAEYSMRNIELIEQFIQILDSDLRKQIMKKLKSYKKMLK